MSECTVKTNANYHGGFIDHGSACHYVFHATISLFLLSGLVYGFDGLIALLRLMSVNLNLSVVCEFSISSMLKL